MAGKFAPVDGRPSITQAHSGNGVDWDLLIPSHRGTALFEQLLNCLLSTLSPPGGTNVSPAESRIDLLFLEVTGRKHLQLVPGDYIAIISLDKARLVYLLRFGWKRGSAGTRLGAYIKETGN